jgi:hypothetical protein
MQDIATIRERESQPTIEVAWEDLITASPNKTDDDI